MKEIPVWELKTFYTHDQLFLLQKKKKNTSQIHDLGFVYILESKVISFYFLQDVLWSRT